MGIFGSFKQANKVVEDARKDVSKKQQKTDEVAARRQQKNQGKK